MRRALVAAALLLWGSAAFAGPCPGPRSATRFEFSGDEARDTTTGLVWRRCALGADWASGACAGEAKRFDHDSAIEAARALGADWRLPTINELFYLVDSSCAGRPLDSEAFPDVVPDAEGNAAFWSLTPADEGMFGAVDFVAGVTDEHSPGLFYQVLAVRGP